MEKCLRQDPHFLHAGTRYHTNRMQEAQDDSNRVYALFDLLHEIRKTGNIKGVVIDTEDSTQVPN